MVRESKITSSSNKQMQEIPDSGWQNLVNNGWFLKVDGLGVHLIVSGAFSISWQMRICQVRNTRLTLVLYYQTQIGHHSEWEGSPLPGGWGEFPGQNTLDAGFFKVFLQLRFPWGPDTFQDSSLHESYKTQEQEEGWCLKWRDTCQGFRKSILRAGLKVFITRSLQLTILS